MAKKELNLSDFKIPPLRMPSKEELRQRSLDWHKHEVRLDHLPKEILALSVPTRFVEIDPEAFAKTFDGDLNEVNRLIPVMEEGWGFDNKFVKLCTRSAKEMYDNFGVTASAKQALYWMAGSERILDDTVRFSHIPEVKPTIAIRDVFYGAEGLGTWELRCFVKDGDLIAVTDYGHPAANSYLEDDSIRLDVRKKIDQYYADKMKPFMHLDTYVFDLCMVGKDEFVLIEVNPFGSSHPRYLLDYNGVLNFKGDIAIHTHIHLQATG